jgi:hypothetical protein
MRKALSWRKIVAASTGTALCFTSALALSLSPALSFCGFYVAQADSKLFNKSSKVVLAWDAGHASVTMASDYEGDPKEFALVVPVPTVVAKRDIRVVDSGLVDKLDAYSAPRLSEYFDEDPCAPPVYTAAGIPMPASAPMPSKAESTASVTVEARYEVGVYDILILSARDSNGLVAWLKENQYRIPGGAENVLGSYIRQGMHFFVAKVNLDRQKQSADKFLKPLQVSYDTRKFMLPIRLGTVNANGPQDLIVFVLSRKGRVETTNYQTSKMPSNVEVPLFAKNEFGDIYKATFETNVANDGMSKVYMEYAWDMQGYSPCDPCSAPVPTSADLFTLGARWQYPQYAKASAEEMKSVELPLEATDAYLTRLHVRYDAQHFPEDLAFLETRDREPFQAIYKLRHPADHVGTCEQGRQYLSSLALRFATEARDLAKLTGWSEASIREKMEKTGQSFSVGQPR